MSLKFYAQKVLGIKMFNPKIQDLNTSILISSIKQTLRPKKYLTDLLTQKNTGGVNFQQQQQKKRRTPPSCIAKISVTSPILINMQTRKVLAGDTKDSFA